MLISLLMHHVVLEAGQALFLDAGNQGDVAVKEAELAARVTEALAKKPGLAVLIRGDKKVDYGRVVTLMAALKSAGVPSVGLMTSPVEE